MLKVKTGSKTLTNQQTQAPNSDNHLPNQTKPNPKEKTQQNLLPKTMVYENTKVTRKNSFWQEIQTLPTQVFPGGNWGKTTEPYTLRHHAEYVYMFPWEKTEWASKQVRDRERISASQLYHQWIQRKFSIMLFLMLFLMTWKDIHQKMTWKDIHQSYFTCKIKQIINEIICSKNEWHRRWSHCLIIILFQTQSMDSNVSWSLTKWDCSTV